ncbi:MAG: GNAT family N-acetyltransferase [Candidatus Bathyarchaeia archaeon]
MPLTVEHASIRNLDRLCEIEQECFKTEAFTKKHLALLLEDYNCVSLVAKENSEIVGFVIGALRLIGNTLTGHIFTIDVSVKYRGKGIGLKLLREIEKIFKEKGAKTSMLEVREDNIQALKLYQKAG